MVRGPAGVANRMRIDGFQCSRGGVAHDHIPSAILRYRRHPARTPVGLVGDGPLLICARITTADKIGLPRETKLIPAHSGNDSLNARIDRVGNYQRFMVDEVPIGEAEHETVAQRVESEHAVGLRNALTAGAATRG